MSLATLKINEIDCYGLNKEDQKRIEEIGLRRWMDEVANQKVAPKCKCDSTTTLPHDALEYRRRQKANITKRARICAVCDKTFYARRSDALYCSQRCRQKGNYRKSLKQRSTPPIPTDNAFCETENQ